jgi:phosphoribosyl 1,2-cyclic phosphodiesterase
MYQILSSSSTGNAVIYHNSILLDCGVPFFMVKPYINDLQLVLITHQHGDHLNMATIRKLAFERPGLRFGIGEFLLPYFEGIRNVDIYQAGKIYNYGSFQISPVKLYHDTPTFGYRIFKGEHKLIHCTDTHTLQGISAKNYSLYALECNYDADTVWDIIREKEMRGEYAHQRGSINSHLSRQQAQKFVLDNAGDNYEFIMLHQSNSA